MEGGFLADWDGVNCQALSLLTSIITVKSSLSWLPCMLFQREAKCLIDPAFPGMDKFLLLDKEKIPTLTVCIYSTVLLWSECDTNSIFKGNLIGLNPEFSFFYTDWYTKVEEYSLPYYLPMAGSMVQSQVMLYQRL